MPEMFSHADPEIEVPETLTVPSAAVIQTLAEVDALRDLIVQLTGVHEDDVNEALYSASPASLRDALQGGRDDTAAFMTSFAVTEEPAKRILDRLHALLRRHGWQLRLVGGDDA